VSRTMQQQKEKPAVRSAGTPIWVWVIYAVGVFAAAVLVLSVLFTVGAYFLSKDVPVTFDISVPGLVLWGGLTLLAAGMWLWRRRR
jgi:LPXTG-motif cell wall-anchored protein